MKNNNTYYFWIPFGIICAVMVALLYAYFYNFHGEWSSNSDDWNNWANYIGEIGTFLLTGLNVWIFFKLTQKMNALNQFSTQIEIKTLILQQLNTCIEPIFPISHYTSSQKDIINNLYLYIAWTDYNLLFNNDIDAQRDKIRIALEYFTGFDKDMQPVTPCAASDNPSNVQKKFQELKIMLRCFQSDLPQEIITVIKKM